MPRLLGGDALTRVAVCFPGQGSQVEGMASALLDLPAARQLLDVAAGEGLDLRAALAGDDEALRPTEIAQPALLLVGVSLFGLLPASVEVVGVAGHSVGEYAALVAAGALRPAAAMRLVIARGRAMAEMREGTMAALLGASDELAAEVCAASVAAGRGPVVVANLNAPGQVVLSGTAGGVAAAVELARERGVRRTMALRVSGAFHSPLMAGAAGAVGALVDAVGLDDAAVPVACNVDGGLVRDAAGLRDRLGRQLASPVRWSDCVRSLAGLEPDALVELGPGGVLTALARRIVPELPGLAAGNPVEVAAIPERLGAVVRTPHG